MNNNNNIYKKNYIKRRIKKNNLITMIGNGNCGKESLLYHFIHEN